MNESFSLDTPVYQGPLEALLDLIERRRMSISDVSLAEVTDAYLVHVEHLPQMPLAETAQFILTASTLLLIKSRTLLPTLELTVDECESVEELGRRLAQYALIRSTARLLRTRWGTHAYVLAHRAPPRPIIFNAGETNIDNLYNTALRLVSTMPRSQILVSTVVAPILRLEDVIQNLHKRLSTAIRTRFSDLTKNAGDRHEVIVYFLAMLELVRGGSASVTQDHLFSDITIELESLRGAPRYGV